MANGVTDYKNVTENTLLRVVDDYHDAISIMSQYPECFQAYKSLIQKKRLAARGGLTADNSQQNNVIQFGIRSTPK